MIEKELIKACKRQDRKAQKQLYDQYAPLLFGICKRYVKSQEDAEDVLLEAFYKIFSKIDQFNDQGSFEGWMRRITVNEALMFLRKTKNLRLSVEPQEYHLKTEVTIEDELAADDILKLLEQLPTGYRTVFNLYVLEGFKHREIADILEISINTSKSQLIMAKKRLQELIKFQEYPDVG